MAADPNAIAMHTTALLQSRLTRIVIREFFAVYNELGFGFLESVYEEALARALRTAGLRVQQQAELRVYFRGLAIGSFRADLLVESSLVLEIKAAERIVNSHLAQVRNYLKATDIEVGLLLNFGPAADFRRVIFSNSRKIRRDPHDPRDTAVRRSAG